MVTNRRRGFVEQLRESANVVRMRMGKPIRADLQLVAPEKSRDLLSFPTRINYNRQSILPDHKAVGSEPQDNGLHANLLDLNTVRWTLKNRPPYSSSTTMRKKRLVLPVSLITVSPVV